MIKEFKKFENSSQDEEYNKEKEEKVEEAIQKLDLLYKKLDEAVTIRDEISKTLNDYDICSNDDLRAIYFDFYGEYEERNIFDDIKNIKEEVEEDEYSDYAKQYLPKNEGNVPILDLIHEYKNTIIIDKDKLKMMMPGEDIDIMDDWNQEGELVIFPIVHAWGGIDFKEWSTAEKYLDMLKDMYSQWIEDYDIDTYNNKIVIIFREDIAENYDLELQ